MKTAFLIKRISLALAACCLTCEAAGEVQAEGKWVEQKGAEILVERQADGDSFGMTVAGAKNPTKRTFRLYGVDCPETDAGDPFLKKRIEEQAEHFGCEEKAIPALGRQAAAFTEKLLKRGKPRVFTLGVRGQEVEKAPGRPQRYYALVEVEAPDGRRRMLHELLLEEGLARAFGKPAAWPHGEVKRHGEKAACEKFMDGLKRLENAAKRGHLGVWKKAD